MPPAAVPDEVLATPFTDYLLRNAAEDRPAFTCLTFPGPAEHTLTWPQVLARVRGVARELRRHTRPGDRVAIVARQDLEYVVAFLGTLYAGLVAMPLSVPSGRTHSARIESAFADARPSVCLTSKKLLEKTAALAGCPGVVLAIEDIGPDDAEPPAAVAMADPAYLQYTSGSTRRPAGAVISHRALVASCWQTTRCYHAGASTPLAGWVPFFHDMGLVLLIGTPVFLGSRSVFFTPMEFVRDPLRWIRLLAGNPGAITAAPNFAFDLAAEAAGELEPVDLSHVNSVLNGSEPVRAATVEAFERAFAPFGLPRTAHKPCYGLAEATVFVTSTGDEGPTVTTSGLVSAGRPYGQRIRIVDKVTGEPLPDGEVGEIRVSGPNVADRYWGQDRPLAPGGWLATGDLGYVHEGLLYVTGRLKDLIIVDGRNHYPQDIEATVEAAHPAVRSGRVAAFAVPGTDGEGVAVVAGCTAPDESVEQAVRRAVSVGHDLPLRALWLVPPGTVPRTSSGKVARAAARDRWWGENGRHG
ncbi:acyl-CoA synthetase (AMP-forming)/AMP-acid ligase II [Amycolatopsis lexingtonensis]|uniref:Acyl-CoA synthetase (AMP-forming)/AMP-acid ligase II n=1 Tax=Amycolatopsis lexingtonensis TaxID=218822 RepID=A0ABR9I6V6_9PSEU|nr:fatty acyl-AMP ligase [Amycolatopsis lexingtonensis]MBE1498928.1 acyl-CoA synthetase (AMP-forming)/AMP-acid ligase II [Amycolatopsis lexingtonensis]